MVIHRKIKNLLALRRRYPDLEIWVYVDAATDGTARILSEYADTINLHIADERHGKTYGMNYLLSQVKASIVLFSDANVMMDVKSIQNLGRYFADPEVGCVCGNLRYVNGDKNATASSGSLYWRLEEWIKQLESDTGSVMGADGSLFAIRRSLHHPPPDDVIDDMFVSLTILCDGYRVVRAPDVVAYEESVTSPREEFKRKTRIACQAFNVHRMLWPRLRRLPLLDLYEYVSHKFLRWLTIYWFLLAFVFFEAGMAAAGHGIWGVIIALYLLFVLGTAAYFRLSPFPEIVSIITAFVGTGFGVWRSIKGERFQTWSPALSIRGNK
jgi:cellulose synthase/poly-beta-1,6-N-acetylglucosamine synthase-like glycosyltransferase